MSLIGMAIVGFVVGLVARAILPGTQTLGIVLTAVLGVAGALLAGWVGVALGWYARGEPAGFLASVVGAVVLLVIVGRLQAGGSR